MDVKTFNLRDVDFDKVFAWELMKTGIVVLTHHGIDSELIIHAKTNWQSFFLAPDHHKNLYKNSYINNTFGYQSSDESYLWKPGQMLPAYTWALTQKIFYQLDDINSRLLSIIDKTSNTTYSNDCFNSDNTILRISANPTRSYQDLTYLTLSLATVGTKLQVFDNNNWHEITFEENIIICATGHILRILSDGIYRTPTIRIVELCGPAPNSISYALLGHPHSSRLLK